MRGEQGRGVLTLLVSGDVRPVSELIPALGLDTGIEEGALEALCRELVASHPKEAGEYKAGRERRMKFFVGQVMKQTKGRADPALATALFESALKG